jgi:hypothetical protein
LCPPGETTALLQLMSNGFVPLADLVAGLSPADKTFYADVIKRDKAAHAEGTDRAGILRRIQASSQCQDCIAAFKAKHPNKPFGIKCFGIYDTPDYEAQQASLRAKGDDMEMDKIREVYDAAFWATNHMVYKNDEGDILPVVLYDYQEESLRCTSPRKVDRWGRGMGKSFAGVVEELHFIANNKKTYTIIVCPSQAQAQMWWDEILFQLENSPSLADMLLTKKQQPYYYFKFGNGGVLAIFTAGSKSGKGADAVRGQSPRRIRLDEQDYLVDKDYQAIMPLLRRFPKSTFHGSSTPTGLRGMFWNMCNRMIEYREFFHPIMDHPNWGTDQLNEESCMGEAQTMDKYRHEWLAQFGDPAAGVFKSGFVDQAMKPYSFKTCIYDPLKFYVMGVDWNGKGTGTRLVVTEYSPATKKRRIVHHETIDDPANTTKKSFNRIVEANRMWHCSYVYVDAGFGFAQDELIKDIGVQAGNFDADTARLKYINVVDFGAKLETNALVPNRDPDSKYLADPKDDLLKRRTKPFMVEGTVMAFEMELVEISKEYPLIEEQIRGYRIKTWTKGGAADTYVTDAESGDHDLDAFMLSMLGIELNYGLWHTKETIRHLVQIAHVSGWGLPGSQSLPGVSRATEPLPTELVRELKRDSSGVKARTTPEKTGQSLQDQYRLLYLSRNSYTVAPVGQQASGGKVPSRTSFFATSNRPGFGSPGRRFGGG